MHLVEIPTMYEPILSFSAIDICNAQLELSLRLDPTENIIKIIRRMLELVYMRDKSHVKLLWVSQDFQRLISYKIASRDDKCWSVTYKDISEIPSDFVEKPLLAELVTKCMRDESLMWIMREDKYSLVYAPDKIFS